MSRKKANDILIPGQTIEFCRDIHQANVAGVTYGVYMGRKHSEKLEKVNKIKKNKGTAAV